MARKTQLPEGFNLAATREGAYTDWAKRTKKAVGVLERIDRSQAYWLFLICICVVIISAAHTTTAFEKVIPAKIAGVPLAVLGVAIVEVGLLYAAFAHKRADKARERLTKIVWAMEILFFLTSLAVNVTGSLLAITVNPVDTSTTQGLVDLITGGIMVIVDGLGVPICLAVVGTDVARLVIERETKPDPLAERWQIEGPHILHLAIHDELVRLGLSGPNANRIAGQLVANSFNRATESSGKARKAPESAESTQPATDKPRLSKGEVYRLIMQRYGDGSGFIDLPRSAQVSEIIRVTGAGKTTVYDAFKQAEILYPSDKGDATNG